MTVSEVLALLDAERDERGISDWEKLGSSTAFFDKLDREVALHLVEVKSYKSGMVELRYEVKVDRGPGRNAT